MPIGWYIVPYNRLPDDMPMPGRYCAMKDHIQFSGQGAEVWTETEVLGNHAIVKVRAEQATLQTLNQAFERMPVDDLLDDLDELPPSALNRLRSVLRGLGYSNQELNEALPGNWGQYTLGEILEVAASYRLKPRYDAAADLVILDGPQQPCRSVESVDMEIQD